LSSTNADLEDGASLTTSFAASLMSEDTLGLATFSPSNIPNCVSFAPAAAAAAVVVAVVVVATYFRPATSWRGDESTEGLYVVDEGDADSSTSACACACTCT
jgi:hypothetical protein